MTDAVDSQASDQRAPAPTFLTLTRFSDFDLHPSLLQGLDDSGFTNCTPIQAETLPVSLAGRDVAGQARTGTGKTAAFMVTVIQRLITEPRPEDGVPRALVVAPTRELARQTYEEALAIGRHLDLKVMQVVGGIDYDKQAEELANGVDIVVGTPGRIIDYIKRKIFKTEGIRIMVIDEADRLFDLGFTQDMRFILRKLPSYTKRQSMLFSATLSYRVLELTYEYMNLPEFISVTSRDVAVEGIAQELFHVGEERKLPLLLGLLQREEWERILIFVNTKVGVEWLTRKLKGNGLPAEMITGDLPQKKRFQLMDRYKNGKIKILVATDVASRGIHVEDISHVINYDLPQDAENYIHRIGRTARAGKQGKALSLACERYVLHLEPVETMLGEKIPVSWPEDDWYVEDKAGPVRIASRSSGSKRNVRGKPSRSDDEERKKGPSGPPRIREKPKPTPKRPADYFPGTFFGFAPPEPRSRPQSETAAAPPAPEAVPATEDATSPAPAPSAAAAATESPKPAKRRRRPRRRRKKPEEGVNSAPPATATTAEPAPDSASAKD